MAPPASRSLPNLALEADDDPPSDRELSSDGLDDEDDLVLALDFDAPAPPEPPTPPRSGHASALGTPRGSPRLHGGAPLAVEWGLHHQHRAAGDRTPQGQHSRSRSPSLNGSIHSAPELELPPSPLSPPPSRDPALPTDEGDDHLDLARAESPGPLSDEDTQELVEARPGQGRKRRRRAGERLATLWDYLQEEIFTVEMDGEEGVKGERVTNFLAVPQELEKIIIFGVFICLDSFLYTFTILPLRAFAALARLVSNEAHNVVRVLRGARATTRKRTLRLSHKCDLVKAAILGGTLVLLHKVTDASKMYHGVRGQETIKLYVLFNVLEIADRLCCSFGQDLQDSLFSRQTLGRRTDGSRPHLRPAALGALTLAYVVAHSVVLFYQLITLNVAVNSYSNALLTLLLSNQFVEIKGSVFKKFEKENLFQLTCADIVERFQLGLMLFIISLRNLIARSSLPSLSLLSYLPSLSPSSLPPLSLPALLSLLHQSFSPAVVVLCSECAVDWLKHAFITKFNHIRPGVYGRFVDVLCKDLVTGAGSGGGRRTHEGEPFVDQSPLVSRRLGFAALPLGCLVVRVISQAFEMLADESGVDECAVPSAKAWGVGSGRGPSEGEDLWARAARGVVVALVVGVGWMCLVALKLLIGISLRSFASHRLLTSSHRLAEEALASRSRPKIGVSAAEAALDRDVAAVLQGGEADGGRGAGGGGAGDGARKKGLEELGRYDMVKSRLW
ncbi:hypothetical protein JCM8208_004629 [Rhodotorula glutinis]